MNAPGSASESVGLQAPRRARRWAPLALVCASVVALYAPTFFELARGLWRLDAHSHGPVVLLVGAWLLYKKASEYLAGDGAEIKPARAAGWTVLLPGLAIYVLGRSQSFPFLEVLSLIPVLTGCTLLLAGAALTRHMWFAFAFLLALVPLGASITDALTQPMKMAVSHAAEQILYHLGYPAGRSGVVLAIGRYRLFVADACAGLSSLFMLEAFGLLYLNLVAHSSALRNAVLAALIVPISFASNVVRVIALALITYHLGAAAGQGFLHQFSGLVLFVSGLLLIVSGDAALRRLARNRTPARSAA
ncbi:MAG: hypothetical protein V7632_1001 [Bradyrhizobium sp.]